MLLRNILFANDAAFVAHTEQELQRLLDKFSKVCDDFGLTISLKNTKIMRQGSEVMPTMTIKDYTLDVVSQFTYLGSTISDNATLDTELGEKIEKAATNMAKLSSRVWENNKLTTKTKVTVYRACVLSTLLFGSEAWATYASQEKRLNTFHMKCLRRILSISWKDKVPNSVVLERADIPSMYTLLGQSRLRWLGHAQRMVDGRIPKDLLTVYGELELGSRRVGRPKLHNKDVCKRNMLVISLPTNNWESLAVDHSKWKSLCSKVLHEGEKQLNAEADKKRARRKAGAGVPPMSLRHPSTSAKSATAFVVLE